jgi:hypothetical protein
MGHMKNGRRIRSVRIPVWMDKAVSGLALEHERNVAGEIEFLVETAIKRYRNRVVEPAKAGDMSVGFDGKPTG